MEENENTALLGTEEPKAHELEDGTKEVVSAKPRRNTPKTASIKEVAKTSSGGKMKKALLAAGKAALKGEFISLRSPAGAAKVQLDHLELLALLWRLWASKRVSGIEPGVAVSDLTPLQKKPVGSVRTILNTLLKSGVIRSVRTSVGVAGQRALYYPTELGVQLLATAETFGTGVAIQIGRNPTDWKDRSANEPVDVFKHAAFLRSRKA